MNGICVVCNERLHHEMRIYQLSVGRYYRDYETPTYEDSTSVIYECHENCLADSLEPQAPPYECSLCHNHLDNGTRVVYLVIGDKSVLGYKRPECRGHQMPLIAHDSCFETKFEFEPKKVVTSWT